MLLELNIRNIALIEKLRVEFGQGLNVLTGETGAGKSIVVDSVNLALGERADRELIRTGAEKASVQAVFDVSDNPKVLRLLDEFGLSDEDGLLVISREMCIRDSAAGVRGHGCGAGQFTPKGCGAPGTGACRTCAAGVDRRFGRRCHRGFSGGARPASRSGAGGASEHH